MKKKIIKCAKCGAEIVATTHNRKYCSKCAKNQNWKKKESQPPREVQCLYCKKTFIVGREWHLPNFCCYTCRTNYQWKQKHPSPESVKTLEAWTAEAKACGLDYGTYRGLIQSGKTFEELKMNFDESKLKK